MTLEPQNPVSCPDIGILEGFDSFCKSADKELGFLRDLSKFYRKRALIEDEYAKNLSRLISKHEVEPTIGEKLRHSWEQIKKETLFHSTHHDQISQSINSSIAEPIEGLIIDLEQKYKNISIEGNKYRETYIDAVYKLRKAKLVYDRYSKEVMDMTNGGNGSGGFGAGSGGVTMKLSSETQRVQKRALKTAQEMVKADKDYRQAIHETNTHQLATVSENLPKIMSELQRLEVAKIHLIKQNFIRYFSAFVNNDHTQDQKVNEILTSLHSINPEQEIQEFIRSNNLIRPAPSLFVYEPFDEKKAYQQQQQLLQSDQSTQESIMNQGSIAVAPESNKEVKKSWRLSRIGSSLTVSSSSSSSSSSNSSSGNLDKKGKNNSSTKFLNPMYSFNQKIGDIMALQQKVYPKLEIPILLVHLRRKLMETDAFKAEGIFRVPGNIIDINNGKRKLEEGNFDLDSENVYNISSILKLWLRDLKDSLIPTSLYDQCINFKNEKDILNIFDSLPLCNQKALSYILKMIQYGTKTENVCTSMMDSNNYATVFSPCFLRSPYSDPSIVLGNLNKEKEFAKLLIEHHKPLEINDSIDACTPIGGGDNTMVPVSPSRSANNSKLPQQSSFGSTILSSKLTTGTSTTTTTTTITSNIPSSSSSLPSSSSSNSSSMMPPPSAKDSLVIQQKKQLNNQIQLLKEQQHQQQHQQQQPSQETTITTAANGKELPSLTSSSTSSSPLSSSSAVVQLLPSSVIQQQQHLHQSESSPNLTPLSSSPLISTPLKDNVNSSAISTPITNAADTSVVLSPYTDIPHRKDSTTGEPIEILSPSEVKKRATNDYDRMQEEVKQMIDDSHVTINQIYSDLTTNINLETISTYAAMKSSHSLFKCTNTLEQHIVSVLNLTRQSVIDGIKRNAFVSPPAIRFKVPRSVMPHITPEQLRTDSVQLLKEWLQVVTVCVNRCNQYLCFLGGIVMRMHSPETLESILEVVKIAYNLIISPTSLQGSLDRDLTFEQSELFIEKTMQLFQPIIPFNIINELDLELSSSPSPSTTTSEQQKSTDTMIEKLTLDDSSNNNNNNSNQDNNLQKQFEQQQQMEQQQEALAKQNELLLQRHRNESLKNEIMALVTKMNYRRQRIVEEKANDSETQNTYKVYAKQAILLKRDLEKFVVDHAIPIQDNITLPIINGLNYNTTTATSNSRGNSPSSYSPVSSPTKSLTAIDTFTNICSVTVTYLERIVIILKNLWMFIDNLQSDTTTPQINNLHQLITVLINDLNVICNKVTPSIVQ